MEKLITNNPVALSLLMTDDLFVCKEPIAAPTQESVVQHVTPNPVVNTSNPATAEVVPSPIVNVPSLTPSDVVPSPLVNVPNLTSGQAAAQAENITNPPLQTDAKSTDTPKPIETSQAPVVPSVRVYDQFDYEGGNNKYILIVFEDKGTKLNAIDKELLLKILGAKKWNIDDIALLNYNKYEGATFSQMKDYFACSKLVLFGIAPTKLGLAEISSNSIATRNNCKIMATYAIAELHDNKQNKATLWTELQKL